MKKLIVGMILGIGLLMAGAFVYFYFGYAPVATSDAPMPMEAFFAKAALHARIAREAPKRDVSGFTTADLLAGADVFRQDCAFCHGSPNQPKSAAALGMFPDPPQLFTTKGMVTDDPAGVTYWKVKNGIRLTGMPGFKASLSDAQIWDVSALLKEADNLPPAVMDALKPAAAAGGDPPDSPAAASAPLAPEWKDARQISPEELAKKLAGPKASRPVVLQVGFRFLFDGAHIPGAIFAGPASSAEGLARLKQEAGKIARNKEVVIYCGCCPWEKCPNVHPAYEALRQMGFTRLIVLRIPQNFEHDWVAKDFPVEHRH